MRRSHSVGYHESISRFGLVERSRRVRVTISVANRKRIGRLRPGRFGRPPLKKEKRHYRHYFRRIEENGLYSTTSTFAWSLPVFSPSWSTGMTFLAVDATLVTAPRHADVDLVGVAPLKDRGSPPSAHRVIGVAESWPGGGRFRLGELSRDEQFGCARSRVAVPVSYIYHFWSKAEGTFCGLIYIPTVRTLMSKLDACVG